MKKVLITGANRSIGFETARHLLRIGYYVYLGSRSREKGEQAADQLRKEGLTNVEAIVMDTDNSHSIANAFQTLQTKTSVLDVLINNAGILGPHAQKATDVAVNEYRQVFNTNFFGVIEVTQTFLPLLRNSQEPRIVNVTSGLGSLQLHTDPAWKYFSVKPACYIASKAALNSFTITLAYELRDTAFKINSVDPGWTATEFNNFSGPGSVEDAAARLVKAATLAQDGPSGKFFSDDNAPDTGLSPW